MNLRPSLTGPVMPSPDDRLAQTGPSVMNTPRDTEGVSYEPSPSQDPPAKDETEYPSGMAVVLIMASVWLAFFLVALVRI